MKNMPVGRKLYLGFGIVILLIVASLAMTVYTSLDRNSQLDRINTMSDLQREANGLMDAINLARVELRTVFTSTDADDEFDAAIALLEDAEGHLPRMEALSAQLAGYGSQANAQMAALIPQVQEKVDAIHENDILVNEATALAVATGTEMAATTTQLVDLGNSVTLQSIEADPSTAGDYLTRVLLPVQKLSETVDLFRIAARDLLLGQDTAVMDGLSAQIDDIISQCDGLYDTVTTDAGRAGVTAVRQATEVYRAELLNIVALLDNTAELAAAAQADTVQLEGLVDETVASITGEVHFMIESLAAASVGVMIVLVVIVVIAIALSAVVAVVLSRAITRPLGMMHDILTRVGTTGNLEFPDDVRSAVLKEAEAKDELGQSLGAFAKFIDRILYIGTSLETVAARDLTVDVELLSEEDTMGNALHTMVANLNEMFSEINSISSQVATSADEIAQGAQSLAQGSTEQASTVQEISASVSQINGQMNTSSDTAGQAADAGREISRIARQGSDKMTQMMGAVQQINDASQAIEKVIKVIDDIAFQTNILALNAAVEAARAGAHGKGFAVVADEVRNWAGKSADAAKETASLISANIEKAELGLTISRDTAESLTQITDGIARTSDSLELLAEQSAAAKTATAQVNLAVDQVAHVVQQNSATSEESAAASEEMSSQAQVLQELIARFRLKSAPALGGHGAALLPPGDGYAVSAVASGGDIIF